MPSSKWMSLAQRNLHEDFDACATHILTERKTGRLRQLVSADNNNAPGIEPGGEKTMPEHQHVSVGGAAAAATAIGALAVGAVAIGALAIGFLAIRRLRIDKASLGSLEIDDLTVNRLRAAEIIVTDALRLPTAHSSEGSERV
jgi:hypothetical protein